MKIEPGETVEGKIRLPAHIRQGDRMKIAIQWDCSDCGWTNKRSYRVTAGDESPLTMAVGVCRCNSFWQWVKDCVAEIFD